MKRKCLLVLVLAVAVTTGAFAQKGFSLSAGIGGLFNLGKSQEFRFDSEHYYEVRSVNGGGYAFFDATYAELSLGISGGPLGISLYDDSSSDITMLTKTNFNIGLLGKYPFWLTDKFALYPLVGINVSICLSLKDEDGNEVDAPNDFSEFSFLIGAGMDIRFTESIYLRFTPLVGFRGPTTHETDLINATDANAEGVAFNFTARLAVGFRFF